MERQPSPHLREPLGERLEITTPVDLPSFNHLLDFGKIIGSGRSALNDAGDQLAHVVSGEERGFTHVAQRLFGDTPTGEYSRHVELCGRSLPRVADLAEVVEGSFRVVAALFEELRAQLKAFFIAGRHARIEEAEKLQEERQVPARATGKVHREPDVEESFANRVEARTTVSRVPVRPKVAVIGEALEERRGFLLGHPHSRRNGGRGLLLVAHACEAFQQRALAGRQVVQPALVEGRDPVEQDVELIKHPSDRLVGN